MPRIACGVRPHYSHIVTTICSLQSIRLVRVINAARFGLYKSKESRFKDGSLFMHGNIDTVPKQLFQRLASSPCFENGFRARDDEGRSLNRFKTLWFKRKRAFMKSISFSAVSVVTVAVPGVDHRVLPVSSFAKNAFDLQHHPNPEVFSSAAMKFEMLSLPAVYLSLS